MAVSALCFKIIVAGGVLRSAALHDANHGLYNVFDCGLGVVAVLAIFSVGARVVYRRLRIITEHRLDIIGFA